MTLAFDVGGCSVLVEPSDQGRKPQPVTAHNRHYVRLIWAPIGAVMCGSWSPGVCVGVRSLMIGRCNGS
jgi:hypothetical protein